MKLFGLIGLILGPIVLAVILAMLKARRQRIILDPNNQGPDDNNEKPKTKKLSFKRNKIEKIDNQQPPQE